MPARRYFLWGEPSSACRWDLRRTCGGVRARRPTDGMTTCANPARAIGDTAPYKIFRRGRCPHRPVRRISCLHFVGRAAPSPPPALRRTPHPLLCVIASQCAHWCGNPYPPALCCQCPQMPTAAPFLSAAKEREERTPSKPRFCNPSAAEVPSASVLPTPRIGICKIRAVLSYGLCVSIRDALCACAGLAGWGETSASTVRRREGTPPYERHESLCKFSSGRR